MQAPFHVLGIYPHGVGAADDGTHAGADHHIDRNVQAFQRLEHADLCDAPRAAAAQNQADARPVGRRGRRRVVGQRGRRHLGRSLSRPVRHAAQRKCQQRPSNGWMPCRAIGALAAKAEWPQDGELGRGQGHTCISTDEGLCTQARICGQEPAIPLRARCSGPKERPVCRPIASMEAPPEIVDPPLPNMPAPLSEWVASISRIVNCRSCATPHRHSRG